MGNELVVMPCLNSVNREYTLPGDKSIAHRSLLIGALPKGEYKVTNFPRNLDCMATVDCMKKLGVEVSFVGNDVKVKSPGYENFNKIVDVLDCKNSGTTARLISGILSGINVEGKLVGDESLSKRPMKRVIDPLQLMGANILSKDNKLPLEFKVQDKPLKSIEYKMPVASAQVKSCVLLAGFFGEGITKVIEPLYTRDHTERLLKYLDGDIEIKDKEICIKNSKLTSKDIHVPGDVSSSAYLVAIALLSKDSTIKINDVLLNDRRKKYLDIIKEMGGDVNYKVEHIKNGEPIGSIVAKSSSLKGTKIDKEYIPYIIDEIPILSVLASFAEGETFFEHVEELKYKESDRVNAIVTNLNILGKKCEFTGENLIINGNNDFINKCVTIETFNDHRIALSFLCASVRNYSKIRIDNWKCTLISFPDAINYFKDFVRII